MKTEDLQEEIVELRKAVDSADTESALTELPETASAGADADTDPGTPERTGGAARIGLVIALVLAVAAVAAWGYLFFVVRPDDNALSPDKQQAAVDVAGDAAAAILTYKSASVDADLEAANSYVTGTFGDYYKTFTRDVVAPAAKEKHIDTTATVVGKSISEFSADRAVVLVFVNQLTTTADVAEPTATSTIIRIELERHGDQWLVSKFDPA